VAAGARQRPKGRRDANVAPGIGGVVTVLMVTDLGIARLQRVFGRAVEMNEIACSRSREAPGPRGCCLDQFNGKENYS
jgi:hypothetical protein